MFPRRSCQWPRGCWPNEPQRLLLRACFLDDDSQCLEAWNAWRRQIPLDFVDGSSLRMLGLLHARLRRIREPQPEMERLAGIARFHWVQTQLLQRQTVDILRQCHEAGLETLLLKGAALNGTIYPAGLRPMSDIDLVVRRSQVEASLQLLERHGWRPRFGSYDKVRQVSHAISLAHPQGHALDLHWDVFHDRFLTDRQLNAVWDASRPMQVGGQPTRSLCPADQLVQTCEHGMRYDSTPPFRWLADARMIIHAAGDDLDWERCRWLAEQHGLLIPVRQTVRYLAEQLDLQVPPEATRQLRGGRTSLASRLAHAITTRRHPGPHPYWQRLPVHLLAYARLRRVQSTLGLGEFLQQANYVDLEPAECLRHFVKLATVATLSHCRDQLESSRRRLAGQASYVLSMAAARAEQLEGVHACELFRGQVFRWTEPDATIRLPLEPADYQAELLLLPARDWTRESWSILFNRHKVRGEAVSPRRIRFQVSGQFFAEHPEQRLVLSCSPWKAAQGDPRRLGFPLLRVRFERIASRAAGSRQQSQAA